LVVDIKAVQRDVDGGMRNIPGFVVEEQLTNYEPKRITHNGTLDMATCGAFRRGNLRDVYCGAAGIRGSAATRRSFARGYEGGFKGDLADIHKVG